MSTSQPTVAGVQFMGELAARTCKLRQTSQMLRG